MNTSIVYSTTDHNTDHKIKEARKNERDRDKRAVDTEG